MFDIRKKIVGFCGCVDYSNCLFLTLRNIPEYNQIDHDLDDISHTRLEFASWSIENNNAVKLQVYWKSQAMASNSKIVPFPGFEFLSSIVAPSSLHISPILN